VKKLTEKKGETFCQEIDGVEVWVTVEPLLVKSTANPITTGKYCAAFRFWDAPGAFFSGEFVRGADQHLLGFDNPESARDEAFRVAKQHIAGTARGTQ